MSGVEIRDRALRGRRRPLRPVREAGHRLHLHGRAAVAPPRQLSALQRHAGRPPAPLEPEGRRHDLPQAVQQVERPHLGPAGPADRLRARLEPPHAHGGRRQHHGARQPPRRQGAQQPQRRRREERRRHLLLRPHLRAQAALRRAARAASLPSAASIASRPDGKTLTLLADDFGQPNGLCFSLDEKVLFVNDTDKQHIRAFDVKADGTLANSRVWAKTVGEGAGAPDGMKIDSTGNVYCCGPGGIHVFAPDATCLGVIKVPEYVGQLLLGRRRPQEPVHHGVDLGLPHPRGDAGRGADAIGAGARSRIAAAGRRVRECHQVGLQRSRSVRACGRDRGAQSRRRLRAATRGRRPGRCPCPGRR